MSTTTTRRSGRTEACLFGSYDNSYNINNCNTIMAKDIIDVADLFEDDIDEKALWVAWDSLERQRTEIESETETCRRQHAGSLQVRCNRLR